MAPIYRHGGHRIPLDLPALAIGSTADTSALWTYDGEVSAILGTVDRSVEAVMSAVLVFAAAVTGAATNYFEVVVTQYSVAGAAKNQIVYSFASGSNAVAYVPIDLSGPVAGSLTNPTGKPIQGEGWQLALGDTIEVKRTSVGTGLASPAFGVSLKLGSLGS